MPSPPIDVVGKVIESKQGKAQLWPVKSNRASELGHPCERFLVLKRTRWAEFPLPPTKLMFIFQLGNTIEGEAIEELKAAGLSVHKQQCAFEIKEQNITGHIDGALSEDGGPSYPFDVKSMNQYDWAKMNSAADLLGAESSWLQKYVPQIMLYCYMHETEQGLLYLKNKATGEPKAVWVDLDYQMVEDLLLKADRINAHVASGTLPECIAYRERICGWCDAKALCRPEENFGDGVRFSEDPQIAAKLDRRGELEPTKREYDRLDKELKGLFGLGPACVCGNWYIDVKTVDRKGYTVDPTTYQRVDFEHLDPDDKEGDDA